ncbi:hypothetical protein WICMUC_005327 [Wickerhamomyces mucosus]|uniref:Uncharacterized protein n=1 Tax=Wickerhamomyces mucosus TaxID=1378264 RepID=A0A9P8P9M1_9ASCO|nr:hypothetical protein WICMUC_005327 [Wickerhamomyces mucosus]
MSTEQKLKITNLIDNDNDNDHNDNDHNDNNNDHDHDNVDEILAIKALNELRNSGSSTPIIPNDIESSNQDIFYDSSNSNFKISHRERLLQKVKSYPFVNNAVKVYKSNKQYGVEMMERATQPMVNIIEQTSSQWKRQRRLNKTSSMFPDYYYEDEEDDDDEDLQEQKRQKHLPSITEALTISNKNLNGFSNSISIESNKRLNTCLQLLKLANKQISNKIVKLQDIISKEQDKDHDPDENEEIYHDAIDDNLNSSKQIKEEIIITVKKVVKFLSQYSGDLLPEPARSNVRETILRLPKTLQSSTSLTRNINSNNGKVLNLANESLDMVSSIINQFDESLNRAELWINRTKQSQKIVINNSNNNSGIKLTKQAILNNSLINNHHYNNIKKEDNNNSNDTQKINK